MWRATLRSLQAHKLRLALSGLAIVLGVAFVSGTMIFTDTLSRTFTDLFQTTAADVTVQPKAAFDIGLTGTGGSAAPSTMPASDVERIAAVDGVDAVVGDVQTEGVYVLDKDGKVVSTGGAPGVGMNWTDDRSVTAAVLTEGRGPQRAGEVALDTGTVEKTGHRVGDTVQVLTPGPRITAQLVGIFKFGEDGGLAGASLTAFDTATAQQLIGQPGRFTDAAVSAADGVGNDELKRRISAALGSQYDVKTQQEQAHDLAVAMSESLRFLNVFLLVFAGVALFVGTFIILNTFAMLVAQRTRELALLRALGANRGQITRSVLGEALVLGVLGSTVGLAAGLGIAAGLRGLFATFGLTLDGGLVFAADTVLWSYAVGVVVTLVAAYLPARRAAKVPPVAAMQDDFGTSERSLRRRTVIGLVLAAGGAGSLIAGRLTQDGDTAAAWTSAGAAGLVLGAVALSPVLARPFLRTAGAVLPLVWGRFGRLARDNAARNPRRTAATASALMVGLALVTGFSIMGSSTKASVDALIDQGLRAEFVISTTVGQPFTPEVAKRVSAVPGVAAVMQHRFGSAMIAGEGAYLTAVDADMLDRVVDLDYLAGSTAGLSGGGMLVDERTADAHGWSLGEEVAVLLPNGTRLTPRIGGIYRANQIVGSDVVDMRAYEAAGGTALDQYVYVDVAEDANTADVRAALGQVTAAYPVVTLKDQGEFKAELRGQVDQLLLLIDALLALSVLIAALGITNTLTLAVIERTREIGLLRAIGTARRQIRRMVLLEAVITSVYGALLGLALGLIFGVSLTHALAGQGIDVLSVPTGRLILFLVVAALIGLVAALWPARRAARLRLLDAIATT
ncbi:FtsX-like permease family protein [Actinoplanes sp. NPDC049802]|uniref:ABC transporter permease n=1 Tax=Actinoplanes sp. NPDC049802 TaxID=3154742 RepID=UPI0033E07D7E